MKDKIKYFLNLYNDRKKIDEDLSLWGWGEQYNEDGAIDQKVIQVLLIKELNTNVVEIGCYEGNTTVLFNAAVSILGKNVLAIDPYNGDDGGNEETLQKFVVRTRNCDNLIFVHNTSQSERAFEAMQDLEYSYCFIDGAHTYEACLSDLLQVHFTMNDGGFVCLDDTEIPEVKQAMMEVVEQGLYEWVERDSPNTQCKHKEYEFLIKI